jgi:hypothetical protein
MAEVDPHGSGGSRQREAAPRYQSIVIACHPLVALTACDTDDRATGFFQKERHKNQSQSTSTNKRLANTLLRQAECAWYKFTLIKKSKGCFCRERGAEMYRILQMVLIIPAFMLGCGSSDSSDNDSTDNDDANTEYSENSSDEENNTDNESNTNNEGNINPGDSADGNDENGATDSSEEEGCKGVDFLFVIDSSRSMEDEQEQLIRSFPGFIDAIVETLELDDFHIMVVDSDAYEDFSSNDITCGYPGCCPEFCDLAVDAIGGQAIGIRCQEEMGSLPKTCAEWNGEDPEPVTTGCDQALGAGHVGGNKNTVCNIPDNQRYIIQGQPDLYDAFSCIADVGTEGSGDEKVMEAMVNAVSIHNRQGGCNENFIRDDAILVVTFITDENDGDVPGMGSAGNAQSWRQALIEAKGGDEEAIVVLGIFGDNDLPTGICEEYDEMTDGDGAMPAFTLREFLELFPDDRRHYCSVCLDDYSECFKSSVDTIDTTCEDFQTPVV